MDAPRATHRRLQVRCHRVTCKGATAAADSLLLLHRLYPEAPDTDQVHRVREVLHRALEQCAHGRPPEGCPLWGRLAEVNRMRAVRERADCAPGMGGLEAAR